MKVLLRESYKWIDAKFEPSKGIITTTEGDKIDEAAIVSIEDDDRKKYVRCVACNEIILNTKKAIEAHNKKCETSKTCLTCNYLRRGSTALKNEKYVQNDDGTYMLTTKMQCKLFCGLRYSSLDINSKDARRTCKYAGCKSTVPVPIEDTFTKFPEAFNQVATVDALDPKNWTFDNAKSNIFYKAKRTYNLLAEINEFGIIKCFVYMYRGYSYRFVYSKKYDKIFWMQYGNYREKSPISMLSSRAENIKKLVSEIYTKEN